MTPETVATFRPPATDSSLPHLGTYRRTLPVAWARLEETLLDWERLPNLHAHSYAWTELEDAGDWGWRARVGLPTSEGPRESLLELRLYREELRVVLRNVSGASAGTEVWTHAVVHGARSLSVIVDFFVPGIAADSRPRLGEAWARVYHQLYDADEAMMVARDAALEGVQLAPPLTCTSWSRTACAGVSSISRTAPGPFRPAVPIAWAPSKPRRSRTASCAAPGTAIASTCALKHQNLSQHPPIR